MLQAHLSGVLGSSKKFTEEQARRWLAEFSPLHALVAAYLMLESSIKYPNNESEKKMDNQSDAPD